MLRTDRGGEFANEAFDQFLDAHSIRREYTTPYTPEQNSVAERENRTIMEGVRSYLHHARISIKFWAEAVHYLVYTLNRIGTRLLKDYTPFEAYFAEIFILLLVMEIGIMRFPQWQELFLPFLKRIRKPFRVLSHRSGRLQWMKSSIVLLLIRHGVLLIFPLVERQFAANGYML